MLPWAVLVLAQQVLQLSSLVATTNRPLLDSATLPPLELV